MYTESQDTPYLPQLEQDEQDYESLNKNCFYKTRYAIKLLDKIPKYYPERSVLSLHLAHNLTFLLQTGPRVIQHYTTNNFKFYQHQFDKIINSITMLDSKNALIHLRSMNQESDEIVHLNLETYRIFSMPYIRQLKQCGVEVFTQNKLFCIKQNDLRVINVKGSFQQLQKIKLTYFGYSLKPQESIFNNKNPVYTVYFISEQHQRKRRQKIMKLNNKSMIGLIKQKPQKEYKVDILIYNPQVNDKQFKNYTFFASLNLKTQRILFDVTNVWECEPDTLCIKCQTYPESFQYEWQAPQTEQEVKKMQKCYEFIWKYKAKNQKKSLQPSKIIRNHVHYTHIKGQQLNLILTKELKQYVHKYREVKTSDRLLDYYYFNQYYEINDQALEKWIKAQSKQQNVPIYYMDNTFDKSNGAVQFLTFRILEEGEKLNPIDKKIISVPYNPTLFIEYFQQYIEGQQIYVINIELRILKQLRYPWKVITTYFITEMIQKCDEDLIYYATNILCVDENQISYHKID